MEGLKNLVVEDLSKLWIEYDRNTDTLYINFGEGEPDESVLIGDNVIANIREGRLISIIVTDFSRLAGL
ncbi:hypothetical protein APE_0682a.1 [Aeropyrum pernix K1]|uniref:DUF2283 domain-containing protein n=1 Tax=Aeropyrum pernix (strain ATCC 700893 / DSM 11879 / JCM 9820 / NBRC 100138 / K1) TaxID=272557 RepID=Q9YE88_AERPE|nr:DUF2283 domain-containing protein [Aeropyrum pernix]BAA79658.2 hypothetical protein APE_0682a.1 [Aeropyrum pernix K1]